MIKTKLLSVAVAVLLGIAPVTADTLKDIEHVVIFMQENRSWDSVSGHCTRHDRLVADRPSTLGPCLVCVGSTIRTSR